MKIKINLLGELSKSKINLLGYHLGIIQHLYKSLNIYTNIITWLELEKVLPKQKQSRGSEYGQTSPSSVSPEREKASLLYLAFIKS